MMRHFAHTAVGPKSYGRGGIANIYNQKLQRPNLPNFPNLPNLYNSLMKMLRHSVGSPWHWSSICSFGKIGCLRSQ